jgi:hypothetical protein
LSAPRPLPNRVDPYGQLVATPERGRLMGNRGGRLHDDDKGLGARRWTNKTWIACECSFRGRRREVFGAGYTELFFRDEPTALAAGHRPCFQCRFAEAQAFQSAFPGLRPSAAQMDAALHAERLDPARLTRVQALDALPDGAMVQGREGAYLWARGRLWRWAFGAYGPPETPPPGATAPVLTPPSILAALAGGYRLRGEGTPMATDDQGKTS